MYGVRVPGIQMPTLQTPVKTTQKNLQERQHSPSPLNESEKNSQSGSDPVAVAQSLSVAPRTQIESIEKKDLENVAFSILRRNKMGTPTLPDDLRELIPNMNLQQSSSPVFSTTANNVTPENSREGNDRDACNKHIDEAEARYGIPTGILRSIALVESNHGGNPWPWTLNVANQPFYFKTAGEAIAAMNNGSGYLRPDTAVGCMQIFTKYHGQRFRNAAHMIDPRTNVFYGAYYLRTLFEQYSSWMEAVARYHSSQAVYQKEYLCRVVSHRIRLGAQRPNTWYAQTCPGGMQTYVAWTKEGNR